MPLEWQNLADITWSKLTLPVMGTNWHHLPPGVILETYHLCNILANKCITWITKQQSNRPKLRDVLHKQWTCTLQKCQGPKKTKSEDCLPVGLNRHGSQINGPDLDFRAGKEIALKATICKFCRQRWIWAAFVQRGNIRTKKLGPQCSTYKELITAF